MSPILWCFTWNGEQALQLLAQAAASAGQTLPCDFLGLFFECQGDDRRIGFGTRVGMVARDTAGFFHPAGDIAWRWCLWVFAQDLLRCSLKASATQPGQGVGDLGGIGFFGQHLEQTGKLAVEFATAAIGASGQRQVKIVPAQVAAGIGRPGSAGVGVSRSSS